MKFWYQETNQEVAERLGTSLEKGLPVARIEELQAKYGLNELQAAPPRSIWNMLWEQLTDYLIIILLGAALVSALLGEGQDSLVILIIVIMNAVLSVVQERRAEDALAALKALSDPKAVVVRDGFVLEIPSNQLVPGDLILLEAGQFIPADARIIESANLRVEEAALTGESLPVEKTVAALSGEQSVGDRTNMAYMGTIVVHGHGKALVTGTGMTTEIGKIAGMLQAAEDQGTPLQRKLDVFGKKLGRAILVIVAFIFVVGVLRGFPPLDMFMTAVSLAVAAIPEGLPAIVTIVLALGVQKMSKRNAIIRRLPAVETLGAATVICSDKTGTLTMNDMTVRRLVAGLTEYDVDKLDLSYPGQKMLIEGAALCNDTQGQKNGDLLGDPTETALVALAIKAGVNYQELKAKYPRIDEISFDSERKQMTTVHRWPSAQQETAVVKGAADIILPQCSRIFIDGEVREITSADRQMIERYNEEMADEALRVLAVAYRPDVDGANHAELETDLVFLGLQGMIDPPRPEAFEAIRVAQNAGIRIIMITGDHKRTATAIAKELGVLGTGEVVTGAELDRLSDDALIERINHINVFARVSPEHKVRIVKALKAQGHIVAMTGDGVNDAPALKYADIGAAMGRVGTDVAKDAADMVLADDNFATIVTAVREGRVIFENIRKAIYFLLSCNAGEVLAIFSAIMLGWKAVPLLPIQILWINLVTDSFPALALGVEPAEPGLMDRPPRPTTEGLFQKRTGLLILLAGIFIGGITLIAFRLGLKDDLIAARSMAFATLSLSQLFFVFNFRSLDKPLTALNPLGNPRLIQAVSLSIFLQLIVFLVPFLRRVFQLALLTFGEVLIVLGLSLATLIFGELAKRLLVVKPS